MAGKLTINAVQLGDSSTASQNFVLQTNVDGTAKLSRGNLGATSQDIFTVDAAGDLNPEASAMVLISRQTAVNAAQIDFPAMRNTVFRSYILKGKNVRPTTNAVHLLLRVAIAGVYQTSLYKHQNLRWSPAAIGNSGSANDGGLAINSTAEPLSTTNTHLSFQMNFDDCGNTTAFKTANWVATYQSSSNADVSLTAGGYHYGATAAIDGFRLLMNSGTIASGVFELYGIK